MAALTSGAVLGGRYRIEQLLSERNFAQTFRGSDLLAGRPVIIKTTPRQVMPPGAASRLEQEAAVLSRLDASEFAPLLAVAHEEGLAYLVTAYAPGCFLDSRLEQGRLSLTDSLTVARAIMRALAHIHRRGIVHGDVKPANVVVDGSDMIERAALIDFGLVRSGALDTVLREQPVGTARYVSPEWAGLVDDPADERSDLYSAGILLFECLVGRPAFKAESVGELLRQHLSTPVPSLRSLGVAVPGPLDELVQRLVRKDPRDRYQSADGVLTDLDLIASAVARGSPEPAVVLGRLDRRRTLTEPALVGRADELAALETELLAAGQGRGRLGLVEGQSGGGKSRLLEEFARRCAARGVWVLRGHGLDQGASAPLQLLSGVVDGVVAAAADPSWAAALKARLDQHTDAACQALPRLAGALRPDATTALGPEDFGEARTLDALAALLDALGSPHRPVVVLLDDCQWADELTTKLLQHWGRGRGGPRHVAIIAAFRSEVVPDEHPLRGLEAVFHLRLQPLDSGDLRLLVESMAGPVPASVAQVVAELSDGNPFMAAAVLRGLAESGALVDAPDGWRLERQALGEVQSSREAAQLLTRRLELLPEATLRVLSIGAVLGRDFDVGLAAALAGQRPPEPALAALEEARRRHIVWLEAGHGRCSFVHDKLREALLDRLSAPERRQLHRLAARRLAELDTDRVFELAYHFDAAGEHARALPYALSAGERARRQHSLEIAEQQYRIAIRGLPDAGATVRRRALQELGEVLMLRGSYEEAGRRLAEAESLATEQVTRAQIQAQLGELAFKRGDVRAGMEALERGLRLLRERVPQSKAAYLGWLLWELVVQALHSAVPRRFLGRRRAGGADTALLEIHLYSRLAYAYWFGRGMVACGWAHLRGMNLAERYPPGPALAQAYSEHAPVMTMVPLFGRGIAYAERSLELRRSAGDPWGEGQSLHFYGVALYGASRYRESMARCRDAAKLLQQTGDRWELNTANWHVAYCLYRLGDLTEAVAAARAVHEAGVEIGDAQAAGIGLSVWAKASGGRVPQELLDTELARDSDDAHTAAELLQAQALQLLGQARPAEAAAILERARRLVKDRGLRQEYVAPITSWLATARRRQVTVARDLTPGRRKQLLREARRAARRARRQAHWYRNNLPHALRESALVAALGGRRSRARRQFDRSLALAARQSARWEQAQTLLARGQVGLELDWRDAAEDLAAAAAAMRDLNIAGEPDSWEPIGSAPAGDSPEDRVSLSTADRFDTLLEVGRRIASALTREAIFTSVREAALVLLRGERCVVLALGDPRGEDVAAVSSEFDDHLEELCHVLVRRVAETGRATSIGKGPAGDEAGAPVTASDTRSALCAPVLVRDRVVAAFYVAHSQVSGLFGHEEERLAEFIATLAGAALENAEGFAEVQALTRTLEERVEERTAQLAAANDELSHRAFHDPLTQLANRVLFRERVEHAIALRQREPKPLAVLLLDLDDFKSVNDTWGHAAGDELLVGVGQRLRRCLRPTDTVARLGGDEFGILLEDPDEATTAVIVAQRLAESLAAPFRVHDAELWMHASIGITVDDGRSHGADTLFSQADAAMYTAKQGGKGRVAVFEPHMLAAAVTRGRLRAALQRAVEADGEQEFIVHYQPIVDLGTGEPTSVEALVRWYRSGSGLTAPDSFVPLAEESGSIVPIGAWVLERACRQVLAWQRARPQGPPLGLHVNLSARQLQEPNLVGAVADLLDDVGLAPGTLVFEITESALMRDPEAAALRLRALRDVGVRLALDDFGTGYSSLAYLQRFPIDMLKIDKCFVDTMGDGHGASALARAIVQLGQTLGLVVVAEGVERPAQAAELRALGCHLGQGFLWSRPQPARDLTRWLQGQRTGDKPPELSASGAR